MYVAKMSSYRKLYIYTGKCAMAGDISSKLDEQFDMLLRICEKNKATIGNRFGRMSQDLLDNMLHCWDQSKSIIHDIWKRSLLHGKKCKEKWTDPERLHTPGIEHLTLKLRNIDNDKFVHSWITIINLLVGYCRSCYSYFSAYTGNLSWIAEFMRNWDKNCDFAQEMWEFALAEERNHSSVYDFLGDKTRTVDHTDGLSTSANQLFDKHTDHGRHASMSPSSLTSSHKAYVEIPITFEGGDTIDHGGARAKSSAGYVKETPANNGLMKTQALKKGFVDSPQSQYSAITEKARNSDDEYKELKQKYDELFSENHKMGIEKSGLLELIRDLKGQVKELEAVHPRKQPSEYPLKSKISALEQELENERLKTEANRKELQKSQENFAILRDRYDTKKEELQKVNNERKNLDKERTNLEVELAKAISHKNELMSQLSATMNRELSRDETELENISVRNRPMKILEEYDLFSNQHWLEAKSALDESTERMDDHKQLDEATRCTLLCTLLNVCYTEAKAVYEEIQCDLYSQAMQYSKDPMSVRDKSWKAKPSRSSENVDSDFQVALSKAMKPMSDKVDFASLCQAMIEAVFKDEFNKRSLERSFARDKRLLDYTRVGLSLCWRMVIQQPPMSLNAHDLLGEPIVGEKAEPHFGSSDPNSSKSYVQYYVFPALFHGKTQMRTARVFLTKDRADEQPPRSHSSNEVHRRHRSSSRSRTGSAHGSTLQHNSQTTRNLSSTYHPSSYSQRF